VKNAGKVIHALEIEHGGPGGKDLKSATIQPGGSTTLVANLKAGKKYEWYCPIDGHKKLGMKGTITVTAGGSASTGGSSSSATSSSSTSGY
jgi:uncharacterized cupredoxin-like copper-binding protein